MLWEIVIFRSDNSIHILSYNVNGLNNPNKCCKIANRLLRPEDKCNIPDIYTFQESRSTEEVVPFWNLILPGKKLYAHGSSTARGVVLGIHPASQVSVNSSFLDPEGRYIVAECFVQKEFFTVVSVYFEPSMTTSDFEATLKVITDKVAEYDHAQVIWTGDFNVVLDPHQDSTGTSHTYNRRRSIMLPFIDAHDLTDVWRTMNPFKLRYTVRKKLGTHDTLSRLDYFLVSPVMLTSITNSAINPSYCSDHNPITLDFVIDSDKRGRGYWKFPEFLLSDGTFKLELRKVIQVTVQDNFDTEPGLLWDTVKAAIRGFTIEYLGRKKQERKRKIEHVEQQIHNNTLLRDTCAHAQAHDHAAYYANQVDVLQNELDDIFQELNYEAFRFKTAKTYYESNRCTKFYFQSKRVSHDSVKSLENAAGDRIYSQKDILQECQTYYKHLYSQPNLGDNKRLTNKFLNRIPRNALSQTGYDLLNKPMTMDEVFEALKDMKKDSVPGEDGLTVNFYLTFWDDIKDLLFCSYQFAYEINHMSITQRRGIIRLLPKSNRNLMLVSSWRPITLLNVDFKAATKLFARRLARFLPDLIHPDQRGFIKHRSIHENLLDVQAVLAACESENTEGMLMLLDIQKAFDSIGWKFLRSVLIQYGFPDYFITWFEIFYTGKELHIINNGHLSEVIFPARGVSQGCSISPLYFILALETLALAIRDDKRIVGMSILGISKKINLLADDGLLALRWTQETFSAVLEVLQEFEEVSNLKINKEKSIIVRIGPNKEERVTLEGSERFKVSIDGSFHYLGIDWNHKYTRRFVAPNFENEFQLISKLVMERNEPIHNVIGRILNVKSLFISKLVYKFQSTPSPWVSWFRKFQSLLNSYIWSFRAHHVNAQQMYLPVAQGGLNMVNLRLFERALKLNWITVALNDTNSFWAAQVKSCLKVPLREFLCYNVNKNHIRRLCSSPLPTVWRCIFEHWCDEHYTNSAGHVGLMPLAYNSTLTSSNSLGLFNTELIGKFHAEGVYTVEDFIEGYDDWSTDLKMSLSADKIMNLMPGEWITQVDSHNFGDISPLEDTLRTRTTSKGLYNLLLNQRPSPEIKAISYWAQDLNYTDMNIEWPRICKIQYDLVQIKLRVFYFRFITRTIPLNVVRAKYANCSPKCTFCDLVDETTIHVYWECHIVNPLWVKIIEWCKEHVCKDVNYSKENCLILGFKEGILNRIMTLVKYHIHINRCFKTFKTEFTLDALLSRIRSDKLLTLNAYIRLPQLNANRGRQLWKPLANHHF